jgi:hypothetical protein
VVSKVCSIQVHLLLADLHKRRESVLKIIFVENLVERDFAVVDGRPAAA